MLMSCLLILKEAAALKTPQERLHEFTSRNHSFSFQYSYPLVLCEKDGASCRGYVPPCDLGEESGTILACLIYRSKTYSKYNFRGATVSFGVLPDAKNETDCFNMPGTQTGIKRINGIMFQSSEDTDHAAGTYVDHYYYRTFNDQCYAADLDIAIVNFGNLEPGKVKRFGSLDEEKVHRKLRQVLDTLVIYHR